LLGPLEEGSGLLDSEFPLVFLEVSRDDVDEDDLFLALGDLEISLVLRFT